MCPSPLGFDLEWRVIFRKGVTPIERRTALVQLSDTRMILLIHISAMRSTSRPRIVAPPTDTTRAQGSPPSSRYVLSLPASARAC